MWFDTKSIVRLGISTRVLFDSDAVMVRRALDEE
jgi:hypothetical protein